MLRYIFFFFLYITFFINAEAGSGNSENNVIQEALIAADTSLTEANRILLDKLMLTENQDSLQGEIYARLGVINYMLGNYPRVEYYFNKSIGLLTKSGDEEALGRVYLLFARFMGKLDYSNGEIFEMYRSALSIAERHNNQRDIYDVKIELAHLFSKYQEFNTSKKYLEEALQIISDGRFSSDEEDSLRCRLNSEYSVLFFSMERYNSSFHYVQKALNIAEKINSKYFIANCYQMLGDLSTREKNYIESITYFKEALNHQNKQNYNLTGGLYTRLAFSYNQLDDHHTALKYNLKALEIREKLGDVVLLASAYNNLGATYKTLGNYSDAEFYLLKGLKIAEELNLPEYKSYSYAHLVEMFKEQGFYRKGLEYAEKYLQVKDSIKTGNNIRNLLKTVSGEEIKDKERRIELLEQLNSKTRETYIIFIIIFALLIATIITTYLYYKNQKVTVEYKRAKEEAERADNLKSQFLSQMSHEIRTPLNSISNLSNLLVEHLGNTNDPEVEEIVPILEVEIKRIIRTMGLMLDTAQIQSNTYTTMVQEIKITDEIVLPVIAEYKSLIKEKQLDFLLVNNVPEALIMGDFYAIEQVFRNVLDNAVKFTLKGKVEVIINRDINNVLEIKVVDTGVGISEDFMDRIYEPFTQEEEGYTRTFDGNGLGLILVKKFCDMNDIDLSIESKKDIGTVVTLLFNMVQND